MDSRYIRLGKNTIIIFIGNASSRIIGLLMLPFYTHFLTKAEYGTSDLINTYSTILLAFVTCCLADSIFIFPKDKSDTEKGKYFTSGIIFSLFTFFITCIISVFLTDELNGLFLLKQLWWVIGLTFSMFIFNYIQQFTRSIDKMVIYSVTGVVYVASLAILSFVLLPSYKLYGYLLSMVTAYIISAIFAFIVSQSYKYFKIHLFDVNSLKELLKYGIPLIPNSIMWWLVDGINRPIMVSNIGVDAIGIYAVANKIPGILTMLFMVFSNAWTISMLEEFGKNDFNKFFNKIMSFLFYVISIGTLFLILASKLVISIFASSEFYEAWVYVPVLSVGVIFQNLSGLIGGVFAAEKKSKYFFYSSFWGALSSVVLTLILVNLYGLMGVCVSVAGAFLCMTLVRLKYAWVHINLFSFKHYIINIGVLVIFATVYIIDYNMLLTLIFFVVSLLIIVLSNIQNSRMIIVSINKLMKNR